ncbi:hypothetical protein VOLCADRAFT_91714 [Volvox carteri f. nagariensis]|uniref:Reverse transcriptase Ty1/copia-type domain-containing protein n=1 Tax=Volvox carteri f. nagariensis TaxID=3068 RepID=D8TXT1_VOLCA|nr:uncharacterized protein VOLCADRAFT_91714 [Volvox carteri f. nagariensis]EFJ47779.1 hypothetical protein VOLCADRAFT_91714 [Volvox carteri f. nagariensis]|eukprot:XP_002951250.1 hypothetical protein VOLCADRAFT_91714 [Volvox carteri f. nagariensis]
MLFDIRGGSGIFDLGEARVFLGFEIERDRAQRSLKLSQRRFAVDLIKKYGMADANPRLVPMSKGTVLRAEGEPLDVGEFRSLESWLVGSLLYLMESLFTAGMCDPWVISTAFQGYCARKEWPRLRLRWRARNYFAIDIQRWVRGHLARKRVRRMREQRMQRQAAAGRLTHGSIAGLAAAAAAYSGGEVQDPVHVAAATLIQFNSAGCHTSGVWGGAYWRGHRARKRRAWLQREAAKRKRYEQRLAATKVIQSYYRGWYVRRAVARLRMRGPLSRGSLAGGVVAAPGIAGDVLNAVLLPYGDYDDGDASAAERPVPHGHPRPPPLPRVAAGPGPPRVRLVGGGGGGSVRGSRGRGAPQSVTPPPLPPSLAGASTKPTAGAGARAAAANVRQASHLKSPPPSPPPPSLAPSEPSDLQPPSPQSRSSSSTRASSQPSTSSPSNKSNATQSYNHARAAAAALPTVTPAAGSALASIRAARAVAASGGGGGGGPIALTSGPDSHKPRTGRSAAPPPPPPAAAAASAAPCLSSPRRGGGGGGAHTVSQPPASPVTPPPQQRAPLQRTATGSFQLGGIGGAGGGDNGPPGSYGRKPATAPAPLARMLPPPNGGVGAGSGIGAVHSSSWPSGVPKEIRVGQSTGLNGDVLGGGGDASVAVAADAAAPQLQTFIRGVGGGNATLPPPPHLQPAPLALLRTPSMSVSRHTDPLRASAPEPLRVRAGSSGGGSGKESMTPATAPAPAPVAAGAAKRRRAWDSDAGAASPVMAAAAAPSGPQTTGRRPPGPAVVTSHDAAGNPLHDQGVRVGPAVVAPMIGSTTDRQTSAARCRLADGDEDAYDDWCDENEAG